MTTTDDDLRARMPGGVISDLGGWTHYQHFRVFTWPWLLRRGFVFWPIALLGGCAYAVWHSSGTGDWSDWPGLAWRACLACLVAVTAGPTFATIVRHLRLPLAAERVLVVASILLGLLVGVVALDATGSYHAHLMQALPAGSMGGGPIGRIVSALLYATVNASSFVLMLMGGGLAAIYYFGERRRIAQFESGRQIDQLRAERDAADLRLAILQAQVEPHFLFNTLASVRSLILSEPERAAGTIDALATYLRATLPRMRTTGVEEATLDRQIDLCLGYLELMNVRMAGRIAVRVDADEAARAQSFPPLILLTLVENAVTHGIEPKPGPGSIAIVAKIVQGFLEVAVQDDGMGLEPGVTQGLGLTNVRAYLRDRFGGRAAFDIGSRAGGGVDARIRIPLEAP